jgi:hypothetical protein
MSSARARPATASPCVALSVFNTVCWLLGLQCFVALGGYSTAANCISFVPSQAFRQPNPEPASKQQSPSYRGVRGIEHNPNSREKAQEAQEAQKSSSFAPLAPFRGCSVSAWVSSIPQIRQ